MFQQAMQAGKTDKSGHELASLVLSLQDRAIGLDFGERPNDPNRNTLFDLLHSRLASQAMQLAAKFTTWSIIRKPAWRPPAAPQNRAAII